MPEPQKIEKKYVETPLMKQYYDLKAKYPDALLLFRVGDFYETFGEDAIRTSQILGITLTKRANGSSSSVELAGFPYHSIDTYLPKLVKAGQRVAICEQLENPKMTKKLVKRGITELVTPGVTYNDKILEHKSNNFLAAVHWNEDKSGISFLDISTGEFYVAQGGKSYIDKLLQSFHPAEILLQKSKRRSFEEHFGTHYYINTFDDWVFASDFSRDLLLKHFAVKSFKGFGVEDLREGIIAAGAALHYLSETQHDKTAHLCKLSRIIEDQYVWLDRFTIRNLELIHSPHDQAVTLLDVLDRTTSPMGSRLLKRWIVLPLRHAEPIRQRLEAVDFLCREPILSDDLRRHLKTVGDLERLISKVAIGKIMPRETLQIQKSLDAVAEVVKSCLSYDSIALQPFIEHLDLCRSIRDKIENTLHPEAPVAISKGDVIRSGINEELDELRRIAYSGKDYLLQLQQREVARTGISNLKVGFNSVFGYYLDVSNSHKNKVPDDWIRKQTLANGERYITEELKAYEQKILTAEEKILELETRIYTELVQAVAEHIQPIQYDAQQLAQLDCLLSFAQVSIDNHYVKPEIDDSLVLNIREGRHPVIECQLPLGEEYISNDLFLNDQNQQILIITGPNMSGKSALLRQSALIVLMAQMGCFVPATEAQIGLVDRIFTRVGASDNISSGESTFMVEMNETASILHNISDRSLILLDEIGRGTSTYDGISLAWSIAEYLHENGQCRPKVLFATHYHELIEMENKLSRVKNYHVSVKETERSILFLRKLQAGGSEHSFGIHVARMAGIPEKVLSRAQDLLAWLEDSHVEQPKKLLHTSTKKEDAAEYQLSFVQLDDPLLEQIKDEILDTDIDTLTPIEALMKLHHLKKILKK